MADVDAETCAADGDVDAISNGIVISNSDADAEAEVSAMSNLFAVADAGAVNR